MRLTESVCLQVAHEVRTAHQFGVHCGADAKGVSASMEQMKRHIEKAQNTVYAQDDSREVLRAAGIAVYTQKEARPFCSPADPLV